MYRVSSSDKISTYPYRELFKTSGFIWNKDTRAWETNSADPEFVKALLTKGFTVTNTDYSRHGNYRDKYFKSHTPPHYCAYCGSKLSYRTATIDHWIPLHKMETGKHQFFYQHLLRIACHSNDPNNPKNLVCSCSTCNKRKAAKTGHWLIRGFFGRYHGFWVIQKFLFASVLLYAVYMLIGAL